MTPLIHLFFGAPAGLPEPPISNRRKSNRRVAEAKEKDARQKLEDGFSLSSALWLTLNANYFLLFVVFLDYGCHYRVNRVAEAKVTVLVIARSPVPNWYRRSYGRTSIIANKVFGLFFSREIFLAPREICAAPGDFVDAAPVSSPLTEHHSPGIYLLESTRVIKVEG